MIQTKNPATGEVLQEYEHMSKEETLAIAKDTAAAQQEWKKLSIEERAPYFAKLAQILREHKQAYAEIMTNEMGKVIKESLAEVEKCAWLCDELTQKAKDWLKEEEIQADGKKHLITYDPLGVIYLVMPWNYPFWQPFKVGMLPLIAGNGIILKHAKNVTGSALLIEDAIAKAGFPKNIFRTVIIDHATSDALIDCDDIAAVSLTGAVGSGSKVAARAAKNIKKTVLELGGSDPFIVCKDADIDKAAKGAVAGRMGNCGQVCIGAKRVIVHKDIAEEFTKKYIEYASALNQGNPLDPQTDIGPLVDHNALTEMLAFIDDAKQKGATIALGGEQFGDTGAFLKPTILTQTNETMTAVREEVFGPIVPIIIVDSEEQAISIANNSIFGLNASIWSKDIENAQKIARKIEAGGVFINHISASHPLLPLGGIKKSGYGRELSHFGIKEFVNIKPINVYE